MLPEELARVRIDKQLKEVGWEIVSRSEYIPNETLRMIFQKAIKTS